jgi:hypothetical protein
VTGIRAVGPGLEDIERRINRLADVENYTSPAAQSVHSQLATTIAAGTDPSGKPWPLKHEGGKALRNAKQAVTTRAAGKDIVVELKGVEVFHHYGAQGKPVRAVIPKEMDEKLGNAIRRGVVTGWNRERKT